MLALTAQSQATVVPPPELRGVMPEARPAGSTRLTVWGFEVYDASLWVHPGFRSGEWARRPLALELRYLRAFDGDDIAKRSLDEMQRTAPIPLAQSKAWLDGMKAAFPDVKRGDRLLGVYEPGVGARFFHNGVLTGAVRDAGFAERFFGIWLGAQTSEPAMREALVAPVPR